MSDMESPQVVITPGQIVSERPAKTKPGFVGLVAFLVSVLTLSLSITLTAAVSPAFSVLIFLSSLAIPLTIFGHYIVQPNEAVVLIFFGRYIGTIDEPGWFWANPFTSFWSRKITLRIRNFTTETTKVNDAEGNPIEIAAVVVWKVVDTAKAKFQVDDYEDFVIVQSETAIRHLGTEYPYDDFQGDRISLRANPEQVAESLHLELQKRLDAAGVEVVETRLTHLAYATEIAEAMLRRQQASAIVAARRTIVEGAVGMVEDALEMLGERQIVELDEERKAAMVSNLLVVLTSEQQTTPIVNTGTIY